MNLINKQGNTKSRVSARSVFSWPAGADVSEGQDEDSIHSLVGVDCNSITDDHHIPCPQVIFLAELPNRRTGGYGPSSQLEV
ncbi:rCG44254 [Rattus norvegicus]|uniref:RCG44254 n=1 Tax=Rattus norvegicus TaxID=10116 RepID=A6KDB2_RAT|nr:rCG44254 [Rattus norvegicus]